MTAVDPDRLDDAQLDDLRRELASMSNAALAKTYETYRMACGLRTDGVPRPATMQRFMQVGRVPPTVGATPDMKSMSHRDGIPYPRAKMLRIGTSARTFTELWDRLK